MAGVKGLGPSLPDRQSGAFPDGYTPVWGEGWDSNPHVQLRTPGPQPGASSISATQTIFYNPYHLLVSLYLFAAINAHSDGACSA